MVKYESGLDATFAALADPTRRAILTRLARGVCSVSELAEPFNVSLPAISKHLSVLEEAGLLARARDGRVRRCGLVAAPLREAADWIARYRRFWEERLDALAAYLEATRATKEEPSWPEPKRLPLPRSISRAGFPPRGRGSSGRSRTRGR